MSTSRTSTTSSSSTLRPRAPRLISGLSDLDQDESPLSSSRAQSSSRSNSHARSKSNELDQQSFKSGNDLRRQRSDITSNPRSEPNLQKYANANGASFAKLWGTSWSAIQGIANDFLGEQGADQVVRTRQRKNSTTNHGKIYTKPVASSWGPTNVTYTSPTSIATGSAQEREALVRAQKRKDLLSGAAASYPDSLGKFKRRTSDEFSSSAPPGANEDRDALVYLHNVKPQDTLAGITIRYGCQANVLRKANRMWPNDNVQIKKVLTLPVDACTVK